MEDKTVNNYFKLVMHTTAQCFSPLTGIYYDKKNSLSARKIFADSKLLKMYCDCGSMFSFEQLRKRILNYNNIKIKKPI